jgi:hypothetical protein
MPCFICSFLPDLEKGGNVLLCLVAFATSHILLVIVCDHCHQGWGLWLSKICVALRSFHYVKGISYLHNVLNRGG